MAHIQYTPFVGSSVVASQRACLSLCGIPASDKCSTSLDSILALYYNSQHRTAGHEPRINIKSLSCLVLLVKKCGIPECKLHRLTGQQHKAYSCDATQYLIGKSSFYCIRLDEYNGAICPLPG